jgi:hypothetical protein
LGPSQHPLRQAGIRRHSAAWGRDRNPNRWLAATVQQTGRVSRGGGGTCGGTGGDRTSPSAETSAD